MSAPLCQVIDAFRSFGAVQALDGVSLEVHRGDLIGIVGPNGSGKTTLFNCMTGRHRLQRGSVLFDGVDVTRWPMDRIARAGLVRTFQQSMYFGSGTVRDNVEMALDIARTNGRRNDAVAIPGDVPGLLAYARLSDLAGSRSAVLSHGSLRRLGIALALATKPSLLLLDEPAAGLNNAESQELAALLRQVRDSGVSMAVVDHDMGFLMPLVDRLAVLSAGRKLKEGSPAEVQSDPEVIKAYLGTGFERPAARDRGPDSREESVG